MIRTILLILALVLALGGCARYGHYGYYDGYGPHAGRGYCQNYDGGYGHYGGCGYNRY